MAALSVLTKPPPKLHYSTVCPILPLGSTGPGFFSVFFFWPSSSTLNADDAILFRTHCDIQLISGLINSRMFLFSFSYPALLMYQSAQMAATEVFVFTISLQICNLFFRNAKLMIADDYYSFFSPYTELNGFILLICNFKFRLVKIMVIRVFKQHYLKSYNSL